MLSSGKDPSPRREDALASQSDITLLASEMNSEPKSVRSDSPKAMCVLVEENLSAYFDSELPRFLTNQIHQHLNLCPKCASLWNDFKQTEEILQREWRDDASLPSSCEVQIALDNILDALPPAPEPVCVAETPANRWGRTASGVAGALAFLSLLASSYQMGYQQAKSDLLAVPALWQTPPVSPLPNTKRETHFAPPIPDRSAPRPLRLVLPFAPPRLNAI